MPTLELLIDASGATRGAQQAEAALGRVKTAAEATATTTARVGASLSGAFQAANGSVQIAQGISQTAAAFGSLNTAAGVFSASRVLLEIGNTARDFQHFRNGIQGATSAWGALGLAFRANPIGLIATGVSVAAAALAIFGGNARKAANEWDQLAASMAKASSNANVERLLGLSNAGSRSQQLSGIQAALAGLDANPDQTFRAGRVQDLLGMQSFGDLLTQLAAAGNAQAADKIADRPVLSPVIYGTRGGNPVVVGGGTPIDPQNFTVTADQFRAIAGQRFQQVNNQTPYRGPGYTSGLYPGPEIGLPFAFNQRNYVEQDAGDRAMVEREKRVNDAEKVKENFARAADYAGQIGDAFGASLADVLFKTASLKQVFQSILQQSVRDGLGGIGRSIFSAAVSGLTPNQQGANAGIRKPGES